MPIYFTFYWTDVFNINHVLSDKHPGEKSNLINKWIEFESGGDDFSIFMQNFLWSKTPWCCENGGNLVEERNVILAPFYGQDVVDYRGCLLQCTIKDLETLLELEKNPPWYWPFQSAQVSTIQSLLKSVCLEKELIAEDITILFHF